MKTFVKNNAQEFVCFIISDAIETQNKPNHKDFKTNLIIIYNATKIAKVGGNFFNM